MAQSPRKSARQALEDHAPWKPPHYEIADVNALKALQAGTANPDQQKRALAWIIHHAAALYEEPYRPGGQDGERDTVLALGRAFAGRQIVKLLNIDLSTLRRNDGSRRPTESGEQ